MEPSLYSSHEVKPIIVSESASEINIQFQPKLPKQKIRGHQYVVDGVPCPCCRMALVTCWRIMTNNFLKTCYLQGQVIIVVGYTCEQFFFPIIFTIIKSEFETLRCKQTWKFIYDSEYIITIKEKDDQAFNVWQLNVNLSVSKNGFLIFRV